MRVAFAGTPAFAQKALEAICDAGFEVPIVMTQPDRPAGRGMRLQASPVKLCAQARGLAVAQPRSLRLDGRYPDDAAMARDQLLSAAADVMVVAAYGLILPPWTLASPRLGCLNIHASLLPRWRGAAPIQRAIEAGDDHTGITVMQMDAGLDTGPMLLRQAEPIRDDDSTASLQDRLAGIGARLIVRALQTLAEGGTMPAEAQPAQGVSYAHKILKGEAAIDWNQPAPVLARRARAFDPFPGLSFTHGGETIKLWRARAVPGEGAPGAVLDAPAGQCVVACGEGALALELLQRAGQRRVAVRDFLHTHPLDPGMRLTAPG